MAGNTWKLNAVWKYSKDSQKLYESMSEEDRIIERLKYTDKEIDDKYQDMIDSLLSEIIQKELERELMEATRINHGKDST